MNTCKNCKYSFDTNIDPPQFLECRIEPPKLLKNSPFGVWPVIHENQWCGKHQVVESEEKND